MRDETLIYAPAIEWWMKKADVDKTMETKIDGIYAVGDGAGLSQGIVHAGATGIVAAEGIINKINAKEKRIEREKVTA